MSSRSLILSLLLLISLLNLNAQCILKGTISNASNGTAISEASVQLKDEPGAACMSDSTGNFSIAVPVAQGMLIIGHVSFEQATLSFDTGTSLPLHIQLIPSETEIGELTIRAKRDHARDNSLRKINFRKEAITRMTTGFGEADVIRSLQSMPGIHKSNEVNAALNVRGTGHGNNQIRLDKQDLHNSYHLLGIVPMFNPDIIESVSLQKSGFNAAKGNALSSFLDVESPQPDLYATHFSVSVCNLSSKAKVETPLIRGKVSMLAAGRYSFFDAVSGIYRMLHEGKENYSPLPRYRLGEGFIKLHINLKNDWKADLTTFHTSDRFSFVKGDLELDTRWKNRLYALNLAKTRASGSRIEFHSGISSYHFSGQYNPSWEVLRQNDLLSWDTELNYQASTTSGLSWYAGAFSSVKQSYLKSQEMLQSAILSQGEDTSLSFVSGIYGHLRIPLGEYLKAEAGLRINHYANEGNMVRLAPRLQLNANTAYLALNLSYDRTYQFTHLISPLGFNIPADLWIPAGGGNSSEGGSPPQSSDQFALNIHRGFGRVAADLGVFYKKLEGISDLKTGTDLIEVSPAESLVYGSGRSWGFETGWHLEWEIIQAAFYYTWSHSQWTFSEINDATPFPGPYDLPHQFDVVLSGKLNSAWNWNVSWFLASGQITTMPTGYAFLTRVEERTAYPIYTSRYNYRMPATHRMDIALQYKRESPRGSSTLSFGLYNAYHQDNPFFLYFTIDEVAEGELAVTPRKMSIFPCTPFINLKIEWN